MPSDWPIQQLGQVGVRLIDCDHRTPPAAEDGFPYVAIPQMKEGRIDLSGVRRISREHFVEWTKKAKPQEHDVVLSRRCNPGVTAHVPAGLEMALGQNLVLLRADGSKVHPPFLRWLASGQEWWDQVAKFINVGAVFESLRCRDVPVFELTLPPFSEQKRIAHILGTLDDKIELNRRMNATLEAVARALFQSWLVDFDPVKRNAEGLARRTEDSLFPDSFEDSEMGVIPTCWEVGRLDQIATVRMGLSPSGDSYNAVGEGIPLINGPVEFGDYFPVRAKWSDAATRFAAKDDLIFCVRGSTTGKRVVSDGEYAIGRGVCAIRANDEFHGFLYQTISFGLERMLSKTTGSVFPSLSAPDIKSFKVVKPPKSVIEAFERFTKPLLEQIQNNCKESATLATLRDTLLPNLLSGRNSVANKNLEYA